MSETRQLSVTIDKDLLSPKEPPKSAGAFNSRYNRHTNHSKEFLVN